MPTKLFAKQFLQS